MNVVNLPETVSVTETSGELSLKKKGDQSKTESIFVKFTVVADLWYMASMPPTTSLFQLFT